jgi:hypothetical protein
VASLFKSAFDGDLYSTYSEDSHYLTINNKDSDGDRGDSAYNPLTAPFMFLTKNSDSCTHCMLRFRDVLSQGKNEFILPMAKKINDSLEISTLGMTNGGKPTTWTIVLNADSDSWEPQMIKYISTGQAIVITSKLLTYTNLGTYRFPSKIEWVMLSYPPNPSSTLLSTGVVTLVSARIPEQFEDSVFTLDNEKRTALTVWDWSQHRLTKTDPAVASIIAKHKRARTIMGGVIFLTLIAPIVIILLKKRIGTKSDGLR